MQIRFLAFPFPQNIYLLKFRLTFRNIEDARIFAMDIGGSLTKIAYYSSLPTKKIVYDGGDASVHYEVDMNDSLFYVPKNIFFC